MSSLALLTGEDVGLTSARYRSLIFGGAPVSAWALDEAAGAGTADDLITTNDGTPTSVTFGSAPLVSGHTSALFNAATDKISITDHASLDIATAITLEAWINWDGAAAFGAVLSKWDGTAYLFGIDGAGDVLNFYVNANISGIVTPVGATVLVPGTTYHVAATYSSVSTTHLVYLNGVQDGSRTTTGTLTVNNAALHIGNSPADAHPYDGKISWAAIYNRQLTAEEIRMRYVVGLRKRKLGIAA